MANSTELDVRYAVKRHDDIAEKKFEANSSHLTFGIEYLNDALYGLLPNDLCLIGAKSGRGKSALAITLAGANASLKKNVLLIALEAEQSEVEMRLRYQIDAGLFFRDDNRDKTCTMSYRNWRFGLCEDALQKYRSEGDRIFGERFSTLCTVYRHKSFSIDDLEKILERAKDWADLVVLDHFHYFDMQRSGLDKYTAESQLIKRIRDLNLFYNKPFFVVAHLRKDIQGLLPGTEDFMGSSDLGKNATTCIMITPNHEGYDAKNSLQETIFSIPKSRTGGFGNVCGVLNYSIRHQCYLLGYKLARTSKLNDKITKIEDEEYPDWAKRATRNHSGTTL